MARVIGGTLVRDEDEQDWTNGRPERPVKKLYRINLDPDLIKQVDKWAIEVDLFRYEAWEYLLTKGLVAVQQERLEEIQKSAQQTQEVQG